MLNCCRQRPHKQTAEISHYESNEVWISSKAFFSADKELRVELIQGGETNGQINATHFLYQFLVKPLLRIHLLQDAATTSSLLPLFQSATEPVTPDPAGLCNEFLCWLKTDLAFEAGVLIVA